LHIYLIHPTCIIYISDCLSIYLSIYISIYLSILFYRVSAYIFVYLSGRLICVFIYLPLSNLAT
jgi:hypothetical protein